MIEKMKVVHIVAAQTQKTELLLNKQKRQRLIAQMLQSCQRHHFIGVNLDFEELQTSNNEALTTFVKDLSEAFHRHGLYVSQDIQPANEDYDVKELAKYDDYLMLMAYDEHSSVSTPGPVSSQQWIGKSLDAVASQIPEQKIILGIGAYGYDWTPKGDNNQSITIHDAMSLAADSDTPINFDSGTFSLDFSYDDENNVTHQVYFNDAATNFNTMRYGCEYGVAGFGLWRLGSEDHRLWKFYGQDLAMPHVTHLRIGDLETIEGDKIANYVGSGEVLDVIGTPRDGSVHLDMDNEDFLIANETYTRIPTSYELEKHGTCGPKELLLTFDDVPEVWQKNEVNNNAAHQHVDIIEANGKLSGYQYYQTGVPFPGANNVTSHKFKAWDKTELLTIENITETDGVVSFIVAGSDAGLTKPDFTVSDVSYDRFRLSWQKQANAEKHILNIKKVEADNSLSAVGDYTEMAVEGEEVLVTGLDEDATYQVSLSSCAASFYSEPQTKTVSTKQMPFTEKQVKNVKVTDISGSTLSASWDAIDDAQQYLVTLSTRAFDGDEQTTSYDFADKKDGMPEGWSTNSSNFISSEGYYGEAAPALRLSSNNSYLIANNSEAKASKLSFWYYVAVPNEGSVIEVQTMSDDEWTTVKTIDASTEKKETAMVEFEPTTQVKICFKRSATSNVLIDDVSVSGKGIKNHPLDRYNMKDVQNATTFTFSDLNALTEYSLTVQAVRNGEKTKPSAEVVVTTTDSTNAIEAISTDKLTDGKMYTASTSRPHPLSKRYLTVPSVLRCADRGA